MPIRIATRSDIAGWAALRARLWDDATNEQHLEELERMLAVPCDRCIAFVDVGEGKKLRGFAEACLRFEHVNGCETSPVAFLEGIFVRPEHRGRGIGRQLVRAVTDWAQGRGCSELASDADIRNLSSHAFHAALGFDETERVVCFRKRL